MHLPRARTVLCLLLTTGLAACSAPQSAPAPIVAAADAVRQLGTGAVDGFVNAAGGHSWVGIPYAAPPVGALRWRAPQPAAPWSGVRAALAPGSPCVQYGWPLGGVGERGTRQGAEDCLYLNVYAPRMDVTSAQQSRLPVMVWIHGGSNTVGHAAAYDGSRLAASQHVVVVMLNYRLGPFGWFPMPAGRTGSAPADPLEASGNFGLLDALAALHWVQDNAAAFGGDRGNVTVFGESAGATDALGLLVSPLAGGLIHRAIIQSLGFGFAAPARARNYVDDREPGGEYSSGEVLVKLIVGQGRAADRAAAKSLVAGLSSEDIAAFLRGIDPWVLYSAYHPSNIETDKFPTVFQDGAVVRTGAVAKLLADPASHLDVPVILGSNLEESKLFMAFDPRLVVTIGGIPVWIRHPAQYDREAEYRGLLWKARGVDLPAAALAAAGTATFAYRWDWRDEGRRYGIIDASRLVGAAHGLELPFLFGNFDVGPMSRLVFAEDNEPGRLALSAAMMSYWAEFAATGRPGRGRDGTLPEWPAWPNAAGHARLLVFDTETNGGIRATADRASREAVVALMASREPDNAAACQMFRATFRTRLDPWADTAWTRFKGGLCANGPHPESRLGP